MTIKSVLTQAEYIGYLKGRIIGAVCAGDPSSLQEASNDIKALYDMVAEATIHSQSHQETISDESMRAIRDGLIRLGGK